MTRDQERVIRPAALLGYAIALPFLLPVFAAAMIGIKLADALIEAERAHSPQESGND